MEYCFQKILDGNFDDVTAKVRDILKKEGFGILTRIDVHEKFKEKLGIDFKKYVILGACNPKMAVRAIEAEENIGVMLPCNVLVYEKDGKNVVAIIKPTAAMNMIDNDALRKVASEVEIALKKVLDHIN